MNVDLERLKNKIQEELAQLEQRRSRLQEQLIAIGVVEKVVTEVESGGTPSSAAGERPAQQSKPEGTEQGGMPPKPRW